MNGALEDPFLFEAEVRRIARSRWPGADGGGAEMIDNRERDGIFETEECLHLIEATTSRTKDKASGDMKKMFSLYEKYRKASPEKAIKCWFITREEPTADQRNARTQIKGAPPNLFNVFSFAAFQASLVDSKAYLGARGDHPFGSIYDPATGSASVNVPFIEVGIRCVEDASIDSVAGLVNAVLDGAKFTLLGEFGVGKSMTLRELYRKLAAKFHRAETAKFPIYINLREHHGQTDPAEVIERHARSIGFPNPSQLVRGWKAGYVSLLIDGFDEVSSTGLQGAWRRLKESRRASMTGIRQIVQNSPPTCGIVIAGRDNFFDTDEERRVALGQNSTWKDIRLDDFAEDQITALIRQSGYTGKIPEWVPTRPLFLTTLFSKRATSDGNAVVIVDDPAEGWDQLLSEVSQREARIEHGVSGDNIRGILECLATLARGSEGGIGPLTPAQILETFQTECGFAAADEALIVLQRLPGLGRHSSSEDARCFVDVEFADACRAGDFTRFALNPYDAVVGERLEVATAAMAETGLAVSCHQLAKRNFNDGLLVSLAKVIQQHGGYAATAADAIRVALRLNIPIREHLFVADLVFPHFELEAGRTDMASVSFTDCYFHEMELSPGVTHDTCPTFSQCLIQLMDGRVSERDLPEGRFFECVIEQFAGTTATNSDVLQLDLPRGVRVLVTVLKKLFVQSLGGRKENAFFRGIGAELQAIVPAVLDAVAGSGLAVRGGRAGEPMWVPVRRQRSRVLGIISSPSTSAEPVIAAVKNL